MLAQQTRTSSLSAHHHRTRPFLVARAAEHNPHLLRTTPMADEEAKRQKTAHEGHSTVVILDYGSQYSQLITRRVREIGVFSVMLPGDADMVREREREREREKAAARCCFVCSPLSSSLAPAPPPLLLNLELRRA
jgi:hypothetical protein